MQKGAFTPAKPKWIQRVNSEPQSLPNVLPNTDDLHLNTNFWIFSLTADFHNAPGDFTEFFINH